MRVFFAAIAATLCCATLSPHAAAGPMGYNWGPLSGTITYTDAGGITHQFPAGNNGMAGVIYDPDDLADSSLTVDAGWMGFGVTTTKGIQVIVTGSGSSASVVILGVDDVGDSASLFLTGDPGPLDANGLPLTLDAYVGAAVSAAASDNPRADPAYRYSGQSVPEPSSLLMGGLTLAAIGLAARRGRLTDRR